MSMKEVNVRGADAEDKYLCSYTSACSEACTEISTIIVFVAQASNRLQNIGNDFTNKGQTSRSVKLIPTFALFFFTSQKLGEPN